MLSLLYYSTATVPFGREELVALLETSRVNNQAVGVTGLLIHHEGQFVQVLEGPEEAVRRTFERISADPRHRDVCLDLEEEIDERGFTDWAMAFRDSAGASEHERDGFSSFFADVQAGRRVPAPTPAHVVLRAFSRPLHFHDP